ncbi:hypothetical protein SUNI508_01718 [Seiridium unicorne]|uniref:Uncharacterized protein n=1 Tax=Seiridium unicorne TaxID=138068 RepID=A0ABR2UPE3_9PEZI
MDILTVSNVLQALAGSRHRSQMSITIENLATVTKWEPPKNLMQHKDLSMGLDRYRGAESIYTVGDQLPTVESLLRSSSQSQANSLTQSLLYQQSLLQLSHSLIPNSKSSTATMQFFKYALAAVSIGSAVAAPAPVMQARDTTVVSTVYSTVSSVKSLVEAELSNIDSVLDNVVSDDVVPLVNTALGNIVTEVNGLISDIVPLVTGLVFPLVDGELENVPDLLTEVKGLVSDIDSTVNNLLGAVVGDVLSAVKPEVKAVLVLVSPLLAPIATLAQGVVNTATGPVVSDVSGLITDIDSVANGIVSPIGGLLVKVA